jgi:AraC-like DNA-binding protein
MKRAAAPSLSVHRIRELARSGELREATRAAREALERRGARSAPGQHVELLLVAAFCAMRQGRPAEASQALDAAAEVAASAGRSPVLALRVAAWRAELAYIQGRYSAACEGIDELVGRLEAARDPGHAAFALRIRMAIHLARTEYDAVAALADRALGLARASGDAYVLVQVLNLLGAVCFDRATSKLHRHARAHLTALDPEDTQPMQRDASEALELFEEARQAAERAGYGFAAWYVAGNIERLEILLGRADRAVPAIRKRLRVLQSRGATYDEIVARSNLAWALRTLGRHRDALHELDAALELARATSTFNVLLEFIHYDRSVVLDALGDAAGARSSYRSYLRFAKPGSEPAPAAGATPRRPLEPAFLKRADRYVAEHLAERIAVSALAHHLGVSWKTLELAFSEYRGLTPVAHVRNMRLDAARALLAAGKATVAEAAARCGFGSTTTFSLEFRKRFGVAPGRSRRRAVPQVMASVAR